MEVSSYRKKPLRDISSYGSLNFNSMSSSTDCVAEQQPILPTERKLPLVVVLRKRFQASSKLIRSKAANLIMLWSFVLGLLFWGDHLGMSTSPIHTNLNHYPTVFTYCLNSIPFCFYPIAGMLADNKFGRYKTVTGSLCFLLVIATLSSVINAILVPILHVKHVSRDDSFVVSIIFFLLISVGSVGFFANNIPLGLDQLYEAPGDHQSLFIYWLTWLNYLTVLINSVSWSLYIIKPTHVYGISVRVVLPILATFVLAASMVLLCRISHWFLADTARLSPYKLIYNVTKFSRQHKVPIRRSAFTFCEEELPKGLDLGKKKYGGPFSTEEVEDVKVFYGILKVILAAGPFFFTDIAANPNLYTFSQHLLPMNASSSSSITFTGYLQEYLVRNRLMIPLLIVIFLPLYICMIRPFLLYHQLGMIKRLGVAMTLQLLSLLFTLSMDVYYHRRVDSHVCMFSQDSSEVNHESHNPLPFLDIKLLMVQCTLVSLSYVIFQIAVFELICSQSPRSMLGMLFGLGFSIRGINNVLGSVIIVPFHFLPLKGYCGMTYYSFNIAVGFIVLTVFTCVARGYRHRSRDELCDYHRYAENYFSRQS